MDIEQLKRGLLQKLQQVGQSFAQKPQQRQPIQPQDNIVSQIGRSPVGQVITNFQRGIEQRTLPKVNLQQYTNGIQNPTLHVVANFGASIGEDLANIPQRLLEGGGRIGTQVVRPLQEGRRVNPNQAVGAFASAISPIVDIATLGGGIGVKQIGKQAIKEAGKESAKMALLKGVMTGAGYGATIGGLRGLSEGNQADYVKGVQGATQGAVFGGIVGGGTAITSQLFGKIKNAFVKSGVPEKEATKEATDYITNRLLRNKRNGQFMSVGKETPMVGGGTFENPSKIKIKRWDAVDKELGIPSNLEEGKFNLSAFLGKGEDVAQPGTIKSQKLSQPLRGPMGEQVPTPEQILAKAEADIKGATENIGGISSKESVPQPNVAQQPVGGSVPLKSFTQPGSYTNTKEDLIAGKFRDSSGKGSMNQDQLPLQNTSKLDQAILGTEQSAIAISPKSGQKMPLLQESNQVKPMEPEPAWLNPKPIQEQQPPKSGFGKTIQQQSSNSIISKIKNKVDDIYTQTMDRFHPLSKLGKQAGEDKAMRNALTGYYGAGSTGQYHVDFELAPILKSTDVTELRNAAIAQRDIELAGRGIQGSNKNINIDLEKISPQTKEALKKLYSYQDNLVKEYLVKTGIMSPQSYANMKANNQSYVPFKRVMDQVDDWLGNTPQTKGAGSVASQNVIKKIKGSKREIVDPLESIVENTYKLVGLGKRQQVAQTIVSLKDKLPPGTIQKINGKLPLDRRSYIALFEKGRVEHYKVPPEVADAARGMSEEQMGFLINLLAAPTRVFRATATGMNPEFALPNVARDLQSAFVNIGVNPMRWVQGLAHQIKKDEVYQEFLKSGGMTSRISLDRPYLTKTVADLSKHSIPQKALRITDPRRLRGILEAIGQYSEQPTRIASFEKALKSSLKNGVPREQALKDAAYAAQEGTVNFARRGSKTQGLNAIYAFVNARAQGTDKLIRSIKSDPKGAGLRAGMLVVAPALSTYAWNRNFSAYNDENVVPQYVKDNNFVIMLSDQPIPALGGGQYITIPKGDIGKLANPIEAFLKYSEGKGGDVKQSLQSALGSFSPFSNAGDIIPTAIRPAVENAANYNFFFKRPIVPESKVNYPKPYQTSKSTPAIYNQVGQLINQSPNMIQNVARGYGTGYARFIEQVTNPFANKDTYSGEDINQTPLIRRFMGGAVRSAEEQQQQDYYKQKEVLNKIQDIKTGIKYGNIPEDVGLNEIRKLMDQQVQSTKPQSYFGPKTAGAAETSPKDKLQNDFEKEMLKMRVKMNGKSEKLPNGDIVFPTDTGASVFEVNPPTGGTGIDAFVNKDWNITQARKAWNNQKLSLEDKNYIYEKLGVDPKDVRYDALANHNADVSTQYIKSKSADHVALLKNIITGRMESISGKQFASNGVIDNLVEQGQLSKEEGKQLKALKFDKNGQSIGKSTSSTKKGKKATKLKVKKANFKIPTKQSNAKTIKSGKPTIIKAPKVSFATQFSKNGAVPKARKYQVKFNV